MNALAALPAFQPYVISLLVLGGNLVGLADVATPMVGGPEWIRVRASGKVNLVLRVGGARPDGYHSLGTVFQAVSIYDELGARWAEPGTFSVTVSGGQAEKSASWAGAETWCSPCSRATTSRASTRSSRMAR